MFLKKFWLSIDDIRSPSAYVFVNGSKEKKDRITLLAPKILELLKDHSKIQQPSCWHFEGQNRRKDSYFSIQSIFRKAVSEA